MGSSIEFFFLWQRVVDLWCKFNLCNNLLACSTGEGAGHLCEFICFDFLSMRDVFEDDLMKFSLTFS